MYILNKLIRPNIRALEPYSCARDEYSGNKGIFMDANENPYGALNRYPDPQQIKLKTLLTLNKSISISNILIGNGSDEIIDLVFRVFCEPGKDKALTISPTYGMYKVCAGINNIELIEVPTDNDLIPDYLTLSSLSLENSVKLLILCSPNNPTGNIIDPIKTEKIIRNFNGIVLIDEAYVDFSLKPSWLTRINEFPNLIVCQTMSKAFALAGARIGIAYSSSEIISTLNKIKPPYNVSKLNQEAALRILQKPELTQTKIKSILKEKEKLISDLLKIRIVEKIYSSETNFLLVKFKKAEEIYLALLKKNIIVRNRCSQIPGCLRITVSTPYENNKLLNELSFISDPFTGSNSRVLAADLRGLAEIKRCTNETDINIFLDLYGSGESQINTGLGFLDHMLYQLAAHSGINLTVVADGDLETGEHHCMEDVAICLGEAFNIALGNRKGIERYGFTLPMDDSLASVAIDFGGRSWLVWDLVFTGEKIADISTEMFKHFFKSFCDSCRCNINIKASGENDHHKIEAVYKAFARSIKMAIKISKSNNIPSTKGII